MAALGKGGETSTGLADFTVTVSLFIYLYTCLSFWRRRMVLEMMLEIFSQTVQYMERLPDVKEAVGAALLSLGDGNWRMGDGIPVAKSNLGLGDESIIIEHFTCKCPLCTSYAWNFIPRGFPQMTW